MITSEPGQAALPYLVCELANSHAGDANSLSALIESFASLNYPHKAIKFQVFGADTIALPDFPWYAVYQDLEFDSAAWRGFIGTAVAHGDVWIDVFDRLSTQIIEENIHLIAGLKLQASVLQNEEVLAGLRNLDLTRVRLAINVSGFGLDEINHFVRVFGAMSRQLILQLGFQAYPTAVEDTALQKVAVLRAAFPGIAIGIADHADGNSDFAQLAPIYAHLLGCTFIEKHFCISRADAKYDGSSALELAEMQQLCDRLCVVIQAQTGLFVGPSERHYLEKSVQVPVLRADQTEGARLSPVDVLFRRTAQQGMHWPQIEELQNNGSVLARPRAANTTLNVAAFRPARVAAIVACRMKSSRLARKALIPLAGVPSVERCLHQCLAIPGLDQVILATSTIPEDAVLAEHLCGGAVKFWAGDADDVISRYLGACDRYGVEVIVRVTADCPLLSCEIIQYLLRAHFASGADYTAAKQAAVGTAGEIINVSALRTIIARLGRAEHSEYMTWYFRNNPDVFKINLVDLPSHMVRDYRLTLDHKEDLDVFEAVFSKLGSGSCSYALDDVFKVLDDHPEIAALNAHIELKYMVDQQLIAKLDRETRVPIEQESSQ